MKHHKTIIRTKCQHALRRSVLTLALTGSILPALANAAIPPVPESGAPITGLPPAVIVPPAVVVPPVPETSEPPPAPAPAPKPEAPAPAPAPNFEPPAPAPTPEPPLPAPVEPQVIVPSVPPPVILPQNPAPTGVAPIISPNQARITPDQALGIDISRALFNDGRIGSGMTHVNVTNGVVTLSGTVPTDRARIAAGEIAARMPGVSKVVDLLDVGPVEMTSSDEQIYRNIRHAFGTDPQVARLPLKVGVVNGRVYLAGDVDTVAARTKAANLAAKVPGVTGVQNALEVAQTHHLYGDQTAGGIYPDKTRRLNDEQLHRAITDNLRENALVDPQRIIVNVQDGDATLTGLVANDTERNAAVHSAYSAGARFVRDQMTLRPPEPLAQAPVIR